MSADPTRSAARASYRPKFGNWTVYLDVPVPFTRRVLIIDLGLHPSLGWRYKR